MISKEYSLFKSTFEPESDSIELDVSRRKKGDNLISDRDYAFIKFDINNYSVDATTLPKIKNSYVKQPNGIKYPKSAKSPRTKIHLKENEESLESAKNDESLFLIAKKYSAR